MHTSAQETADVEAADQVARNIARLLVMAEPLPVAERRRVYALLAQRSPHVRRAHAWTEVFGPLFVVGALFLLGSVFVVLDDGPLWLAVGLIVAATVATGVPAIKVWHCAVQALDTSVGACVAQLPADDRRKRWHRPQQRVQAFSTP